MSNEVVQVSYERLRELEALEAGLPQKIENAIAEYKKNSLKRLHERDKADPKSVNLRVKRYVEKHKEEINAKRREKRKMKKLQDLVESYKKEEDKENMPPVETVRVAPIEPAKKIITVHVTRVPQPHLIQDVTVCFNK